MFYRLWEKLSKSSYCNKSIGLLLYLWCFGLPWDCTLTLVLFIFYRFQMQSSSILSSSDWSQRKAVCWVKFALKISFISSLENVCNHLINYVWTRDVELKMTFFKTMFVNILISICAWHVRSWLFFLGGGGELGNFHKFCWNCVSFLYIRLQ